MLLTGFEERFGGSLKIQANKMLGLVDTLADKYRAFGREIAEPLFEPLQNSLRGLVDAIDAGQFDGLTEALKATTEALAVAIPKLTDFSLAILRSASSMMSAAGGDKIGFAAEMLEAMGMGNVADGVRAFQSSQEGDRQGKLTSPQSRRDAVQTLQRKFSVSERRACDVLDPRSASFALVPNVLTASFSRTAARIWPKKT